VTARAPRLIAVSVALASLAGATPAVAGAHARTGERHIARATIASIQHQVAGRAFAAGAARYTYASWPDPATGKVVLMTDAPRAVTAPLSRRFAGALDVRPGGPRDELGPRADLAPFWGGGSIMGEDGICSAGFTVRNAAGTSFLVTAGHCFQLGGEVRTTDGGARVGSVVTRGPIPPFDMELIGGRSYGGSIFVGSGSEWSRKRVAGAADPVEGDGGYCRSGQTTGERCGQTILSVDAQVCTQTGCKSPVIVYTGGVAGAGAPGDSGAPLYRPSRNRAAVRIAGMHIAAAGTISFAEKWSRISSHLRVEICVSPPSGRAASRSRPCASSGGSAARRRGASARRREAARRRRPASRRSAASRPRA
jgi:hypothetical protein